jgi:hypothetical protein
MKQAERKRAILGAFKELTVEERRGIMVWLEIIEDDKVEKAKKAEDENLAWQRLERALQKWYKLSKHRGPN